VWGITVVDFLVGARQAGRWLVQRQPSTRDLAAQLNSVLDQLAAVEARQAKMVEHQTKLGRALATLHDQAADRQAELERALAALRDQTAEHQAGLDRALATLHDRIVDHQSTTGQGLATLRDETAEQQTKLGRALATLHDQAANRQAELERALAALRDQIADYDRGQDHRLQAVQERQGKVERALSTLHHQASDHQRSFDNSLAQIGDRVSATADGIAATREYVGARGLKGILARIEREVQGTVRRLNLQPDEVPYPERLTIHRFRLLSQNEEDGIILALLREAGFGPRRFVEIGCGSNGGNSGLLAAELGWCGLMLDGNEQKVQEARWRFGAHVVVKQAWITRENVNDLIAESGLAGEIDLLSIDLDGVDYWIWDAITACSPRLVVVEFNSMFGPSKAVTVPYDPGFDRHQYGRVYHGASLAAFVALGRRKNYRLVATEPRGVNAFFLRNDLATHIPTCEVERAWHLMNEYSAMLRSGKEDVYALAARVGAELVDVSDEN
jgi:hypothetical protein